jgi:hypothetical protein
MILTSCGRMDMKKNKKLIGIIMLVMTSFLMGSFFNQSEAKLKVIKAGVDDKGIKYALINLKSIYLKKIRQRIKSYSIFMTPRVIVPWLPSLFLIPKA